MISINWCYFLIFICGTDAACTEDYDWSYKEDHTVEGVINDELGNEMEAWTHDINFAKRTCVRMGDTCGGVTGMYSSGGTKYYLRASSSFKYTQYRVSWLKPADPCDCKFSFHFILSLMILF